MDELIGCEGVMIGGKNINNIRYADDVVLITNSEGKLQILVNLDFSKFTCIFIIILKKINVTQENENI